MTRRPILAALGVLLIAGILIGCLEQAPAQPDPRAAQANVARQAAASLHMSANAEIDNIKRRLELTGNPTLLGYIVLLNGTGQPIMYEGVRGKVTSSGSRLTPPDDVVVRTNTTNGAISQVVTRARSDVGTFDSSSSSYIYYWNTDGVYRQWTGDYLYSDKPIRLRVEPLVVTSTP